jgi:hypothetical protein
MPIYLAHTRARLFQRSTVPDSMFSWSYAEQEPEHAERARARGGSCLRFLRLDDMQVEDRERYPHRAGLAAVGESHRRLAFYRPR